MSETERRAEVAMAAAVADSEQWKRRPRFAGLLLYGQSSEGDICRTIESFERQVYREWTLTLIGDGSGTPAVPVADRRIRFAPEQARFEAEALAIGIRSSEADYVVPVKAGNILSATGLFRLAEAIQQEPDAAILYGDQDELAAVGRRIRPWFKPRWNREMFLAQDYLSDAVAIRIDVARNAVVESAGNATLSAFLVHAIRAAGDAVVHIPHVLCHVATSTRNSAAERLEAVSHWVADLGGTCDIGPFDTIKVDWSLPPKLPLVSIIVPTRDQPSLLRACVNGVLDRTAYRPFELIIVDNNSVERETLDFLAEFNGCNGIRVLYHPQPYNFSEINNRAAGAAHGDFLCLLNNDTEVLDDNWLTEMMRYAVRPEVGAVGAKLLYSDRTIQHAGVVIGVGGAAGHAHRFAAADSPGYFCQAHVAQYVSAVTAACLVVDKAKFHKVGGLDEEKFAVAFNDVDFCLKLQAQGYRNVYVPHAVLLHHESKSRGSDARPENVERYRRELRALQQKWQTTGYQDPLHNPNLDGRSESYIVRV